MQVSTIAPSTCTFTARPFCVRDKDVLECGYLLCAPQATSQGERSTIKQYDLIVIGAGSAGLVAALTAHRRGLKVAMLDKFKIGGECTHSGCVPSKTLIHVARTLHESRHSTPLGLPAISNSRFGLRLDMCTHFAYTWGQ